MQTTQSIFERYEAVRARLPKAVRQPQTRDIASLLDIVDEVDAFVFDAFGVLNVGDTLIPGADRRLQDLRAAGCQVRILTNAASFGPARTAAKFARLGFEMHPGEVVASREAALAALSPGHWGALAAAGDDLSDIAQPVTRLADDPAAYDAVTGFLFLSAAEMTEARFALLMAAMDRAPRPVLIANADLAAPREGQFSVEPGFYGHRIADRHGDLVRFFGKPFGDVYALTEASLPGIAADRIAMCGDTLHTDILGAAARGWRSVLVTQDGLFAGHDTTAFADHSCIHADWRLPRI